MTLYSFSVAGAGFYLLSLTALCICYADMRRLLKELMSRIRFWFVSRFPFLSRLARPARDRTELFDVRPRRFAAAVPGVFTVHNCDLCELITEVVSCDCILEEETDELAAESPASLPHEIDLFSDDNPDPVDLSMMPTGIMVEHAESGELDLILPECEAERARLVAQTAVLARAAARLPKRPEFVKTRQMSVVELHAWRNQARRQDALEATTLPSDQALMHRAYQPDWANAFYERKTSHGSRSDLARIRHLGLERKRRRLR